MNFVLNMSVSVLEISGDRTHPSALVKDWFQLLGRHHEGVSYVEEVQPVLMQASCTCLYPVQACNACSSACLLVTGTSDPSPWYLSQSPVA